MGGSVSRVLCLLAVQKSADALRITTQILVARPLPPKKRCHCERSVAKAQCYAVLLYFCYNTQQTKIKKQKNERSK